MRSFEELVVSSGEAACSEWEYPPLPSEWLQAIQRRLPTGLRATIAEAVENGSILIIDGHRFSLSGLAPSKGPYALFSRSAKQVPAPNWEYFVQAAEYGRVVRAVEPRGLRVDFEDDLMDISVYEADRVVWCIEVKEKARDLEALLLGMRRESLQVDLTAPDRHNDPLRKSKYLLRHRRRTSRWLPSVSDSTSASPITTMDWPSRRTSYQWGDPYRRLPGAVVRRDVLCRLPAG